MMFKKKIKKTIFYYIGFPIYRIVFFAFTLLFLTTKKYYSPLKFKTLNHKWILVITVLIATYFTIYNINNFLKNLPNPKSLSEFPNKLSTKILDRNGNILYQIFQDENRSYVKLGSLHDYTINAFIAAEDKDFYKHHGFSLSGLARAVYKNIFNQKIEGGSTITQQLVKNTLLTNEKTVVRKIKELILSIKVESIYSKDQILEVYLNQVGFGGPAYGIQEAARQYFDINASELDVNQSAYLAGITRAPTTYSPFSDDIKPGIERKNQVLSLMITNGFINQEVYQHAKNENLVFRNSKNNIHAPHFVMLVKELLTNELGESLVSQGGLTVTTTLDLNLQKEVQKTVTLEVEKLKNLNVNNGSSLVTNPKSGEILAMVGSKDYFNFEDQGQVNLTTSLRQPGSSIKPLNYALSFEYNKKPTDTIEDKPITVYYKNGQTWSPKNYDNKYHGTVTLKQALANSYNIPSVLLLKENGIQNFANFAHKMGISNWNDPSRYGLSMSLGSLEVKMTELATAYSAFSNNGILSPLKAILKVEDSNKQTIHIEKCISGKQNISVIANNDNCLPRRVISEQTASYITDILSDNNARSAAFGSNSVLKIQNNKVAVKTGTSNDLRDNWTIGYNNNYLVASWVGNNNNQPMSQIASGVTGASPIWSDIFKNLLSPELAIN